MNNILYVYIDESVDFGFSEESSMLYVVSFVFYDDVSSIDGDVSYLNKRLVRS